MSARLELIALDSEIVIHLVRRAVKVRPANLHNQDVFCPFFIYTRA
jgi:hypothetical protein